MAELVDALDSKSGYRKVVQVRFLFGAHSYQAVTHKRNCFFVALKKIALKIALSLVESRHR